MYLAKTEINDSVLGMTNKDAQAIAPSHIGYVWMQIKLFDIEDRIS